MLNYTEVPCGIFRDDSRIVFVVQRYFQDFVVAASRLYVEICGYRHDLIHIWEPNLLPE